MLPAGRSARLLLERSLVLEVVRLQSLLAHAQIHTQIHQHVHYIVLMDLPIIVAVEDLECLTDLSRLVGWQL
jgi:hypothetical protein